MKMRTTKPNNNPYYITTDKGGLSKCVKGKPTDKGANVLANCVGYANGRFAEIMNENKIKYQFIMNAENVVKYAKQWGLEISDVPTLGGIMVFEGLDTKDKKRAGHVLVVEENRGKNIVYTSESSYGGKAFFNKVRNKNENNWGMGKYYKYLGCIVNPKIGKVVFEEIKKSNYKTLNDLYVRTGPSTKYGVKLVKQLSADGRKNATSKDPNTFAAYKKGTIFTALEIFENKSGTWAKTPSGFVCIIGASGRVYSEKC